MNIDVWDVPVTQNINCIVVIDKYGLWINIFFYQYVEARLVIVVVMVIGDVFSPKISQIYWFPSNLNVSLDFVSGNIRAIYTEENKTRLM